MSCEPKFAETEETDDDSCEDFASAAASVCNDFITLGRKNDLQGT